MAVSKTLSTTSRPGIDIKPANGVQAPESELDSITRLFEEMLTKQYNTQDNIRRGGDCIMVPEHVDLADAAKAIMDHLKSIDEEVETVIARTCHPDDGLVCFARAMRATFGQFISTSTVVDGFFGPFTVPAKYASVQVDYGQPENVPVGAVKIPGLNISIDITAGYGKKETDPTFNRIKDGGIKIIFKHKRLYKPLVEKMEKLLDIELTQRSIFRNKAINSAYEFIDLTSTADEHLVYSAEEGRRLSANLFLPIRCPAEWARAGNSPKRTVLLHGRFGTGKSLTALHAAKLAVQAGWTFMNVRPGDSILPALEFAKQYQPCVIFFEDVDVATAGDRDEDLNKILNTVDGLLSKNSRVITILTTNRIGVINQGMLRPGRIDALIEMGDLDAEGIKRLAKEYAGSLLEGDLDAEDLYRVCTFDPGNGEKPIIYSPAFIVEGVSKAKAYAMDTALQNGVYDGEVKITHADIRSSLVAMESQFKLMMGKQIQRQPELDRAFGKVIKDTLVETGVIQSELQAAIEEAMN